MPYKIKYVKGDDRPYKIVNTDRDEVVGSSKTRKNAKSFIRHSEEGKVVFRAWNKKSKMFIYDVVISWDGNLGQVYCHSSEGHGGIDAVKNHPDKKDIEIRWEKKGRKK